jgi:hypothetical protein
LEHQETEVESIVEKYVKAKSHGVSESIVMLEGSQALPVCPSGKGIVYEYKRSDNEVRELTTLYLLWQQWSKASIWFEEVGISAFHRCVVVDLWQSLSEWRLLLSECVLMSCITTMHLLTRHCL